MLEAAGLDMDIIDGDIAARCNFATADPEGVIIDRRAGRISLRHTAMHAAAMKAHSWHHVPVLIHSAFCGADDTCRFTENECNKGGLGTFESRYLVNYLLANAMKLKKFGA